MKFKIEYLNEQKKTILSASKKGYNKFLKENLSRIKSIEPITESVKVTSDLINSAWNELMKRARRNYISVESLDAVCDTFAQNDTLSDDRGLDTEAFYKLYDILIDKMDEFGYELLSADEFNKKFDLPNAPQTSFDVRMKKLAQKLHNQI